MKLTLVFTSLLLTSLAASASLLPMQSDYYYKLGGDADVYAPPINRDQVVVIGGNVNSNLGGLNCNLFNPVVSISNTFLDLKNSVNGIPASVIDNLKGSVAGFPMYKLQQAMPGLYNILQNSAVGAQNEFALKVQDCQAVKHTLEEGKSPITSMLSVSDSQGWLDAVKRSRQGESVDITKTAKDLAIHGDEYGLPWVHHAEGNSGGRLQKPIKVMNDVVIAGYNLLLTPSRALDNLSKPSADMAKSNPFLSYWPTPEEAAQWATLVLGEIQITHKKDAASREAKAGVGLSTLLQSCPKIASSKTCAPNISHYLWDLVDKKIPNTEANLRKLSASNILMTEDIISTLQRMPREQQVLTVAKLSEAIAIQNLLDEAMMLRRLLTAGFQIQEVQNLKPVQTMITAALQKLDDEIHAIAFEHDIRRKMMTQTLNLIMELRAHDLAASLPGDEHEQSIVKNGAIYRDNH
jgi:integrating conjugative element protein (TIGR03755 family)